MTGDQIRWVFRTAALDELQGRVPDAFGDDLYAAMDDRGDLAAIVDHYGTVRWCADGYSEARVNVAVRGSIDAFMEHWLSHPPRKAYT